MEFNKFIEKYFDPDDDSGFTEMVFERQAKIKQLRERIKKYRLSEEEMDNLFKIIEQAEIDIEKIKRGFKKKNYTEDDLVNFQDKIVERQQKMQTDFENKLTQLVKNKYERAKKIYEEMKKQNPYL